MSGVQPQAKKFFFFEVVAFGGAPNKSSSTCNQQCWNMTTWGWRWGKSCHQTSQAPPHTPRCEGWSQIPSGADPEVWDTMGSWKRPQLETQKVNQRQLCHGSCQQAVHWLRPLGGSAWLGAGVHLETSRSFLQGSPHKPSAQHDRWLHNPRVPRGHPSEPEESEKVKLLSRVWLFATPWTVTYIWLLQPWDFPGKNAGVGCHFLLQGGGGGVIPKSLESYAVHIHVTHTHTHTHTHTGICRGTYLFLSSFSHPAVSDSWRSHGL